MHKIIRIIVPALVAITAILWGAVAAQADFTNMHLCNQAGLCMSADGVALDQVFGKVYANTGNDQIFSQGRIAICTTNSGNHVSTVIYDPADDIFCPFTTHSIDQDLQGNPIVEYTNSHGTTTVCLAGSSNEIVQLASGQCTSGNGVAVVLGNVNSQGNRTNVWVNESDRKDCHADTTSHGANNALSTDCANGNDSQYWASQT